VELEEAWGQGGQATEGILTLWRPRGPLGLQEAGLLPSLSLALTVFGFRFHWLVGPLSPF
jgi:hypothetical protein